MDELKPICYLLHNSFNLKNPTSFINNLKYTEIAIIS